VLFKAIFFKLFFDQGVSTLRRLQLGQRDMQNCTLRTWIALALGTLSCTTSALAREHLSLLGEFVYMRRTELHNLGFVKDSNKEQNPCRCPSHIVIDNKDLVNSFEFEPGYRVALVVNPSARNGFEGKFLYLQPWHGEKSRHGDESLSFPFSKAEYSNDFHDASLAKARYTSHFWDAELNYWRHLSPSHANYFGVATIVGLRYFHLNEAFRLTMTKPPDKSSYNIHTKNRIYGAQVGLDFQWNPTHWLSWEVFAKAGLAGNDTHQHQFLGDDDNQLVLRDSGRKEWQLVVFADVAAELGFRFLKYFYLHGGYEMLFLSGLSLAPEQISKSVGHNAGKKDYTHGKAIIHGLYAGLTVSF
jgi:hypothetical protein